MKILLPESEGKTKGGEHPPIVLSDKTKKLLKEFVKHDPQKLLGVKGDKLEQALVVNRSLSKNPTRKAILRFSGVVYDGLDYNSLSSTAKKRADKNIFIMTAMFGLIRADTHIPEYKLKINTCGADKVWMTKLDDFVIDLLPKKHQKAVQYDNGIVVEFKHKKDGKLKPAGHFGKLIKGRFARFLIEENTKNPKDMLTFNQDGYKGSFNDNTLTFVKNL